MNRIILLLLFGWSFVWGTACREKAAPAWQSGEQAKVATPTSTSDQQPAPSSGSEGKKVKVAKPKIDAEIPAKALETLAYIEKNGEAPKGYVGGRTFQNRERRLPTETASGERISYQEWDVNPKERGKNRGAERLITGSDKSAYYTKNHYKTFIKIEIATDTPQKK